MESASVSYGQAVDALVWDEVHLHLEHVTVYLLRFAVSVFEANDAKLDLLGIIDAKEELDGLNQ